MMTKRMMVAVLACTLMNVLVLANPVRSALGARLSHVDSKVPSYTVADYVQDGLCAIWDGIDNAGIGIHDGSLTEWRDLIGECPLIWDVRNCTWEDNAIANFTTANINTFRRMKAIAYAWWNSVGILYETDEAGYYQVGDYTIELVARSSVNASIFRPYSASNYFGFEYNSPWGKFRIIFAPSNNWTSDGGYKGFLLTGLENIPISYSGSASGQRGGRLFANGNLIVENDSAFAGAKLNMEHYTQLSVPANGGAIYCLRIYNRVLDENEVAHNYRVDKVRFGL